MITELSATELRDLMPTLESGMVPRWRPAAGCRGGLACTVVDGRVPHALLPEDLHQRRHRHHGHPDGLVRLGSRVFSRDEGIPPQEYDNGEFGASSISGWRPPDLRRAHLRTQAGPSASLGTLTGSAVLTADPTPSRELSGLASSAAVLEAYSESVMNTFGAPKRVFVRGEACYLWDAEGRRYLDLLSGLAVNALGHAHPTVLSAVTGQIATLGHVQFLRHSGPGRPCRPVEQHGRGS